MVRPPKDAQETELLGQRSLPDDLAGVAVDARRNRQLLTVGVNAARGRIADGTGPAASLGGDVGEKHVVRFSPDDLAGRGVEAKELFLFVARARLVANDRVELAAHHDRRAATAGIFNHPEDVAFLFFLGGGIPGVDQTGLARNAVLFRATPIRPIERIGLKLFGFWCGFGFRDRLRVGDRGLRLNGSGLRFRSGRLRIRTAGVWLSVAGGFASTGGFVSASGDFGSTAGLGATAAGSLSAAGLLSQPTARTSVR